MGISSIELQCLPAQTRSNIKPTERRIQLINMEKFQANTSDRGVSLEGEITIRLLKEIDFYYMPFRYNIDNIQSLLESGIITQNIIQKIFLIVISREWYG